MKAMASKENLEMVPDLELLELEDHAQQQLQRVRLLLMAVMVLCAMIAMALSGGPFRPLLFWTGSGLVLFYLAFRQHSFLTVKNTALVLWPNKRLGLFQLERVKEIYLEIIAEWSDEQHEAPTLFITEMKNRPAFTVRNCLTSDSRFQAIYLSEDLFFWLNSAELKSVLAHEVAHYYRYNGAMMRCYPLVLAINAFLPLTILDLMGLTNLYVLAIAWPLLHHLIRWTLLGFQRKSAYWQEYLADAAAVRGSAPLDTVNGLLLIHKRMDNLVQAYRQVLRLMKKNVHVPLDMVDDLIGDVWDQLPRRVMGGQTVQKVVNDLFAAVVKPLQVIQGAEKSKMNKRNRQLSSMLRETRPLAVRKHFGWEKLRPKGNTWRLDEAAYQELIESLLVDPDRHLTFFSALSEKKDRPSHPLLRKRILFIHKNFVLASGQKS